MSQQMPGQPMPGPWNQPVPETYPLYGTPTGAEPGMYPYQQPYGQPPGQFPHGPGVAPGSYPPPNPYGQDPYGPSPYQTQYGTPARRKPWMIPVGIIGIILGVVMILVALSDPTQSGRLMFRGLIPIAGGIGLLIQARRQ